MIYLVLATFNASLLRANHAEICANSAVISSFSVHRELPRKSNAVSSAYIMVLRERADGRSFMYSENNIGPSTVPWGIPHVIFLNPEDIRSNTTHCFLSAR